MSNVTTPLGVGGSSITKELGQALSLRGSITPITREERVLRIAKAQALMKADGIAALYLDATTSLTYFTGLKIYQSERTHGAVIPADGDIIYICPAFEEEKLRESITIGNNVRCWEEHESPYVLLSNVLCDVATPESKIAIDENAPFFLFDGLRQAEGDFDFVNGATITGCCRMIKSEAEIALMQRAKDITIEVHKAAGRILKPGITTIEVAGFIDKMHRASGADAGSTFCIVLFGEATAYPHGVSYPQTLAEGDMVLIDTGCQVEGYHSDITRSYVYGQASPKQTEIWNLERDAQMAAFNAAQIGVACSAVDDAARVVITNAGLGPDYQVPGLPHRTGHGVGMDIHEWTYLVRGNETPLASGMCFSNEPMICLYGEFGVRLEDHFYMTDAGPRWFTQPSKNMYDPFNLG